MYLFPLGTKVETTEEYYKAFKRKVYGEVVGSSMETDAIFVKWTHQFGNVISDYQDKSILMMTRDLQKRTNMNDPIVPNEYELKVPEKIVLKRNMLDDDELVMFYAGVPYDIEDGAIIEENGVRIAIEDIWVEFEHVKDATFINCNPVEVKKLVTKDRENISSYLNVSIEEMDHLVEFAIKYQKLHNAWVDGVNNKESTTFFLRTCKEVIEGVELKGETPMT